MRSSASRAEGSLAVKAICNESHAAAAVPLIADLTLLMPEPKPVVTQNNTDTMTEKPGMLFLHAGLLQRVA